MKQLLWMRRNSQAGLMDRPRLDMKIFRLLAVVTALAAGFSSVRLNAAEGVALAIIYDTSGSMKDAVQDQAGGSSPKYIIANRALLAVTKQLEAVATNTAAGAPRKIEAGLFVFEGQGAREAVKFGPFDPGALRYFAKSFSDPSGSTPLGNALTAASRAVLRSSLPHKHILVITDGMNTAGPAPSAVLPKIKEQAQQKETSLSVHFVAFDVDAKVFSPVKKQGATVVSASNEAQLNTQLDFILQRKILLEEEEPPASKAK
jgi:hypothetical protein